MKHSEDLILTDTASILAQCDFTTFRNARVLITGANGFLGQYLISTLVAANRDHRLNCKIVCVSLHRPGQIISSYLSSPLISFHKLDLAKPFRLSGKFDYVFHAAGYGQPAKFVNDPLSTIAINVNATQRLLEICERSKGTFVLFSSAEVYGEMPSTMTAFPESYTGAASVSGPRAVYAAAKRLAEALVLSYEDRVRVRIVRISAVYGPGAPATDARVMSDFIRQALTRKKIVLLDSGASVRTFGYLADIAAMIFFVATTGSDTVYNVGGTDTMSIRELAEHIATQTGASVSVPARSSRERFVGKDPKLVRLDLKKIKTAMGGFRFTPFGAGLANTIAWAKRGR